jgi:hypothetical protein
MRPEIEREFQRLLEQHDREFLRSVSPAAERVLREQEFDRHFRERISDIVEPIMAKARALMRDHGVHAEIVVTQRRTEPDGKITPSGIAFEFQVLTDAEAQGFPVTMPTLAFIAEPGSESVLVHENSMLPFFGGHIGVVDHCTLDTLTGELVEKHLLAVAKKVLRGTGAS